jgi:hypothetical protein
MVTLLASVLLTFGPAQVDQNAPHKVAHGTPKVTAEGTPVTQAEALKIFTQNQSLLSRALEMKVPGHPMVPNREVPVTREQTVSELYRVYAAFKPDYKFTPLPTKYESGVIKIAAPQRGELLVLVKFGFVGPFSPLAAGPSDTLSVSQFGDTLGMFISRLAQLTHMPTPKWSPILGAGGVD